MMKKKTKIIPDTNVRKDWVKIFKKANALTEDSMIDGDGMNLTEFDKNEWVWNTERKNISNNNKSN